MSGSPKRWRRWLARPTIGWTMRTSFCFSGEEIAVVEVKSGCRTKINSGHRLFYTKAYAWLQVWHTTFVSLDRTLLIDRALVSCRRSRHRTAYSPLNSTVGVTASSSVEFMWRLGSRVVVSTPCDCTRRLTMLNNGAKTACCTTTSEFKQFSEAAR